MNLLNLDEKWSIEYDPENNDRPLSWFRYGKRHSEFDTNNAVTAMFYALLEDHSERDRYKARAERAEEVLREALEEGISEPGQRVYNMAISTLAQIGAEPAEP